MQNSGYLPSASPKGWGILVKMLIFLELICMILLNIAYLYILTLSRLWYAKRYRGFTKYQSGWSWSVSEIADNS